MNSLGGGMNSFVAILLGLFILTMDAFGSEGSNRSREQLARLVKEREETIDQLVKRVEALEAKVPTGSSVLRDGVVKTDPPATPPVIRKKAPEKKIAENPKSPSVKGGSDEDQDSAQRALERTLVISGALLVPYGQFEVQPGFSYFRYSAQDSILTQQGSLLKLNSLYSNTDMMLGSAFLRLGLPLDAQLEAYVPYESIGRNLVSRNGSQIDAFASSAVSGFSDVRVGLAKTLLTERNWWPDVIARITWNSNTGQYPHQSPIGLGYHELAGSLTVSKRQDPLVFYGTVSYQAPLTSGNRSPGDILGVTIGTILGASPETSMRFFINQNFVSNSSLNGQTLSGTYGNISTLNIGGSTVLGKGFFMDLTAGVGLTRESPDYTVGTSFAYRFDLPFLPELM